MRYRILGRLAVWDGQEWCQISAAKWRSLLTYLLINTNRFVPADRLIAELWGEKPPASAAKSLQVYVYRLRRALGTAQSGLLTQPGGYELSVAPDEVDADRFTSLVREGRRALTDRQAANAVRTLTEALALWRGDALADVPSTPTVLAEAERLAEQRLTAWELLADAKLAAGRHTELVADLRILVGEQPLREPLWGKLMVALHRSGRRSDALASYAAARQVLRDEMGVPPGSELQQT
jgi:DNA-binding SARP family transcriptional activator